MSNKEPELFYWQPALFEQPQEGEKVVIQYKTFEYDKIVYKAVKKEWFIRNVQCWLKRN